MLGKGGSARIGLESRCAGGYWVIGGQPGGMGTASSSARVLLLESDRNQGGQGVGRGMNCFCRVF